MLCFQKLDLLFSKLNLLEFLSIFFTVNILPFSKVKGKRPYDTKMVLILSKGKKKEVTQMIQWLAQGHSAIQKKWIRMRSLSKGTHDCMTQAHIQQGKGDEWLKKCSRYGSSCMLLFLCIDFSMPFLTDYTLKENRKVFVNAVRG